MLKTWNTHIFFLLSGGYDDLTSAYRAGNLLDMINAKVSTDKYDYDLAVIGGGSGGLAAAKVNIV